MKPPSKNTRRRLDVIVGVFIGAAVIGTVSAAVYFDQVAPYRRTIVSVGNSSIDMGYFLNRIMSSGREPLDVLDQLIKELLIKEAAGKPPFALHVAENEIDGYLRARAAGSSGRIADAEFREWYRQRLADSRLSEADFRDSIRTLLLGLGVGERLAKDIPPEAEQVDLQMITTDTAEEAGRAKRRLDSGEPFFIVARDVSSDLRLRERSGAFGWVPRTALPEALAKLAFDQLPLGKASDPVERFDASGFAILMISDRSPSRKIDVNARHMIEARMLDEWLSRGYERNRVVVSGLTGGYDSATDGWVRQQLIRMRNGRSKPK